MDITELIIEIGFWISWLLIPIVYELVPALKSLISLSFYKFHSKRKILREYPFLTLIIPVYNSEKSLYNCIRSVSDSTYPSEYIKIIVVDNQSKDNSFDQFVRAQNDFSDLIIQWMSTDQGKARALNSAIYNSIGKYVVHIDSDGILEKNALKNIIAEFENDVTIDALTGAILTRFKLIKDTKSKFLKFIRENEYLEYAQSFLAGRAIESEGNKLFTMSGAFSAFRRDKLLYTQLYNTETVGEDIDMTFQIRYQLNGKVLLCPNAIFYVDPLDDLNKLYTQRQRWQRGELETLHLFLKNKSISIRKFFSNFIVRRLIVDHTILLLRMIWLGALISLISFGYAANVVGISFFILYLMYLIISSLNFVSIQSFLKQFPLDRKYYISKWYILFSLPVYYFVVSCIQVLGIINSMTQSAKWTTTSLKKELVSLRRILDHDIKKIKDNLK